MRPRLTRHAEARMAQRGYQQRDIELLLRCGDVCRDGLFLDRRCVDNVISELKREMTDLERLSGSLLILERDDVKTIYRPDKTRQRRQRHR